MTRVYLENWWGVSKGIETEGGKKEKRNMWKEEGKGERGRKGPGREGAERVRARRQRTVPFIVSQE